MLEKEREHALLKETIADLREDKWRPQATALLEDHRPKGFFQKASGPVGLKDRIEDMRVGHSPLADIMRRSLVAPPCRLM